MYTATRKTKQNKVVLRIIVIIFTLDFPLGFTGNRRGRLSMWFYLFFFLFFLRVDICYFIRPIATWERNQPWCTHDFGLGIRQIISPFFRQVVINARDLRGSRVKEGGRAESHGMATSFPCSGGAPGGVAPPGWDTYPAERVISTRSGVSLSSCLAGCLLVCLLVCLSVC